MVLGAALQLSTSGPARAIPVGVCCNSWKHFTKSPKFLKLPDSSIPLEVSQLPAQPESLFLSCVSCLTFTVEYHLCASLYSVESSLQLILAFFDVFFVSLFFFFPFSDAKLKCICKSSRPPAYFSTL